MQAPPWEEVGQLRAGAQNRLGVQLKRLGLGAVGSTAGRDVGSAASRAASSSVSYVRALLRRVKTRNRGDTFARHFARRRSGVSGWSIAPWVERVHLRRILAARSLLQMQEQAFGLDALQKQCSTPRVTQMLDISHAVRAVRVACASPIGWNECTCTSQGLCVRLPGRATAITAPKRRKSPFCHWKATCATSATFASVT